MKFPFRITGAILLLIMLISFGCVKDKGQVVSCNQKSNSIDIVRKLLPGNYNWAYTNVRYLGGTGFTKTPVTQGMTRRYVFTENGQSFYYENDTLRSSDLYLIDYELKVTQFPTDSATIVIINDSQTGQRKHFFRAYLCNDSALFYNPHSSFDIKEYLKRN